MKNNFKKEGAKMENVKKEKIHGIEIYDYTGESYMPAMSFGKWRVAYLNDADVFREENFQIFFQEIGNRFLDEGIGNRLFRLVFIRGLRGCAIDDYHQAILDIRIGNLAFVFVILALRTDILIKRKGKRGTHCLVGRATVFKIT